MNDKKRTIIIVGAILCLLLMTGCNNNIYLHNNTTCEKADHMFCGLNLDDCQDGRKYNCVQNVEIIVNGAKNV